MDVEEKTSPDVVDLDGIKEMIPHRDPFLMIDRVEDIVVDTSAVGIKNINSDEPVFKGHFPARPVFPGVLIIEAMAQTAAVLVVKTLGPESAGKLVYFMTVENARFRKPVTPGDVLKIHVEKVKNRGNVWKFSAKARVDDAVAAEANFAAMILDD